MASVAVQEFTLHLPVDVIDLLQRTSAESNETPDQIVAEALLFSLKPVRREALRRLKTHIQQQQTQSEHEIRRHLETHLTSTEQEQLSELLERNRSTKLSAEEQEELQHLFDRIESVATEKAAAMWLLSAGPQMHDPAK